MTALGRLRCWAEWHQWEWLVIGGDLVRHCVRCGAVR